jgi:membrane protein
MSVRPVVFVRGVVTRLTGTGIARNVAALSFTTVLGVVPLFTVAFVYVARYPLFQEWQEALERFLLRHMLPASEAAVRGYLTEFTAKAGGLQGVSIAFVVITAMLLVATVEREINAIWGAREPRSWLRRVFVYALGVTVAPLLIGAAIYSTTWLVKASVEQAPFVARAAPLVATPLAVAITTLAFTLLYALLPSRHVPLRAACWGGLFAALGFEVAKYGFRVYVTTAPTYQVVYGTLSVLPLFLVWIYVSWYVILVGAAVAATLAEGGPRGRAWRSR